MPRERRGRARARWVSGKNNPSFGGLHRGFGRELRNAGSALRGFSPALEAKRVGDHQMDDPDIATAATSGVTWPRIAIGTAAGIVGGRKGEVLANEPAGPSCDRDRQRHRGQALMEENHIGGVESDVAEAGAIDACAAASAGASFNPSPTIRTLRPEASSAAMCVVLSPGNAAASQGTSSSAAIGRTAISRSPEIT